MRHTKKTGLMKNEIDGIEIGGKLFNQWVIHLVISHLHLHKILSKQRTNQFLHTSHVDKAQYYPK